jgi:TatA/E family protein of Tat protein translocase
MFGLGHGPELILVLLIALIVLGPGKIPEIAQFAGKALRELRQASADLQKTFDVNELMNAGAPPPPTPPPVEAAPAPMVASSAETIAPPELTAKPKRTRRPRTPAPVASGEESAPQLASSPLPLEGEEAAPKKPRARRPSRKAAEPVSIDAPA